MLIRYSLCLVFWYTFILPAAHREALWQIANKFFPTASSRRLRLDVLCFILQFNGFILSSPAPSSGHFQINWNTSWELSPAAIVRSEGKLWQFLLPDVRISKTNEVSMISLVPIWTSTIHHYSQGLWNHNFVLIPPSLASIPDGLGLWSTSRERDLKVD